MRSIALASVLALMSSAVLAKCPNNCSGHGSCTEDDVCRCWPGFMDFDCSKRSCPVNEAWAVDAALPHSYAECSNRGVCDRATGECKCFDNYVGRACERSTCPNDCSGHGKCRMMQDWPNFSQDATLSWDEKAIQSCVCDGGYFGADCSMRECPHGDDPITTCEQGNVEQVQRVKMSYGFNFGQNQAAGGGSDIVKLVNDDYYLSFTTAQGEEFVTKRITGAFGSDGSAVFTPISSNADAADAAKRLEAALESLPNFAIRDVTVSSHFSIGGTSTVSTTSFDQYWFVTFHHLGDKQNNYGVQNLLECPAPTWGCSHAGCRPLVRQPYAVVIGQSLANADVIALKTDVVTPNTAPHATRPVVVLHPDSVLPTCPEGKSCTNGALTGLSASINVLLWHTAAANNHVGVYVKVTGKGDAQANTHDFLDFSEMNGATLGPAAADTPVTLGYTYAGELTSANEGEFDISQFVSNTKLKFYTGASTYVASTKYFASITYGLPTCSVSDITAVDQTSNAAKIGTATPFSNVDVENIVCSGRGSCNYGTGQCECFEGYTGLACGTQTVLV